MTKLETQARIEVMQAYVDGFDIEYDDNGSWVVIPEPHFYPHSSYRVKPEAHAIEANIAMEKLFDDIRAMVNDHKVNSANFFEHLGAKLKS